jgi:hypothetical protein
MRDVGEMGIAAEAPDGFREPLESTERSVSDGR